MNVNLAHYLPTFQGSQVSLADCRLQTADGPTYNARPVSHGTDCQDEFLGDGNFRVFILPFHHPEPWHEEGLFRHLSLVSFHRPIPSQPAMCHCCSSTHCLTAQARRGFCIMVAVLYCALSLCVWQMTVARGTLQALFACHQIHQGHINPHPGLPAISAQPPPQ